jgi:YD repeat-containing protein
MSLSIKLLHIDAANRLTSVNEGGITTTYTYSGDGDRVSQTVDGVTTTYVIDVAAPLTMVLAEKTGNESVYYLHGLNLIGQSDGVSMEYFTYDGLGSVRQVVDGSGEVLYGQGFRSGRIPKKPFGISCGNPYFNAGDEKPNWGFNGEQTDEIDMIFLEGQVLPAGAGPVPDDGPVEGGSATSHVAQSVVVYLWESGESD